jgi:hydroxymethylpyrimidine/phosphomethylpyrimidine kinase
VLRGLGSPRREGAHDAALALVRLGCRAVLMKGGHLGGAQAVDLLAFPSLRSSPTRVIELRLPRLSLRPFHGGGCVLASLIAGRLAVREETGAASERAVIDAVRWAKKIHHAALLQARDVGGDMRVLLA